MIGLQNATGATAPTADDSIRAIQRWVAQDIRYVALELGIGGYQPRMPDTVLATGFGDCKDKASLFIAALRTINVDAFPVLLNTTNRPDPELPTIGAFNHEIAAIRRPAGYQYVDLTSEFSPFGSLPGPDRSGFALVVHPDGRTEQVTIPGDSLDADRADLTMTALGPARLARVVRRFAFMRRPLRDRGRDVGAPAHLAELQGFPSTVSC